MTQYSQGFFHQLAHPRGEGDMMKKIKILHPAGKTPRYKRIRSGLPWIDR